MEDGTISLSVGQEWLNKDSALLEATLVHTRWWKFCAEVAGLIPSSHVSCAQPKRSHPVGLAMMSGISHKATERTHSLGSMRHYREYSEELLSEDEVQVKEK